MKLIVTFLLFVLLSACSVQKSIEKISSDYQHNTNPIVSALLKDSKKISNTAAVSQLVKAIESDPNNPELFYSLGYLHIQNAQKATNIQEKDLATRYFKYVLSVLPGNQAVINALYNIYYDDTLHNRNPTAFENAKKMFSQLQENARASLNPPSLAKYVNAVVAQENSRQTNHQQLREILLSAIQEQPKNDNAYIQLAKIFIADRYFSLALATLKLGTENIQDSAELYKAVADAYEKRASVNGCNYEHRNDIVNASKYYKMAIPLRPEDQHLHYSLSLSLFDQNLYHLGLNEADIALSLDDSPTNLSISAQNYSMLGDDKKATNYLQRATTNGLNENDVAYHEVFMNQGEWQKAARGFAAYAKARDSYSVYDVIKSDIISQQAKQQPWIINKKISLNNTWEENLLKFWGAKISADELKKLALTSCEKTEYYFYTGYRDYQQGHIAQAKTKFNAALNQNTYRFIERPLARYFLQK